MYHAQFPDQRMPDHRIFQRLHRQLRETGLFYVTRYDAGRRRAVHNPSLEESILNVLVDRPGLLLITLFFILEQVLPGQPYDVPITIPNHVWFLHERTYPDATFEARWIGRGGQVPWLPRSFALSSLDYFSWKHMKNLVHATPLDSDENLVARISEAAAHIREIPGIFEHQTLHRRCQACIA
ncbi:uncharacterized protein TNCV_1273291 [Trichonephila clavipes]|nr:uncharacterized protein TNCV_1273291 [Trichonephila clavipes]